MVKMTQLRALVGLCGVLVAVGVATPAQAQNAQQVVEDLNRDAMEAYNGLDIDRAGAMLEEALRVATQGGIQGPLLALTNMNLGIIFIGGLGDNDGGLSYFVQAICADPNTQLDPLTSTPDIQSVFQVAQQQAQAGACPQRGAAPAPQPTGPVALPEAVVHHSPPEQLSQTPLPLYTEVSSAARARKVNLYYKGLGMEQFKRVPMVRYRGGFAYQISCQDVWEPKVSYYIEAVGDGGRPVGTAGSAAQPIEVPIVSVRSQGEVALPGASPPASCAASECPPGLKGCKKRGQAAIGDQCERTADCQGGLNCEDDVCILMGGGGTDAPEPGDDGGGWGDTDDYDDEPKDDGEFKRFFVQLGFNMGFSYVQAGMKADRDPPDNRVFVTDVDGPARFVQSPEEALAIVDPSMSPPTPAASGNIILPDPNNFMAQQTAWVPDADSGDSLAWDPATGQATGLLYGGGCGADGKETGPQIGGDRDSLYPSNYCVRVKTPGFVPGYALRAAIGYFVTDRFALSIPLRIQFGAGSGTLAGILIGLRAEYNWIQPQATGLMFSNYLGFSVGQIQAKPPATGETEAAPWVVSGPVGANLGLYMLRYRFHQNFGIYSSGEVDIQFPDFLFNIDWNILGVEAAF